MICSTRSTRHRSACSPSAGDLDGDGHTFSASDLDTAGWSRGARITANGATFTRADVTPGHPDNVLAAGQTVTVSGSAPSFPATVAYGPVTHRRGLAPGRDATTAAVTLPHWNTPSGTQNATIRLHAVSVPINQGTAVSSVTLPNISTAPNSGSPPLHIFDLAVRNTAIGPNNLTWQPSWATAMGTAWPVPQSGGWTEQTLRMALHPNLAGNTVRIKLTNAFSPPGHLRTRHPGHPGRPRHADSRPGVADVRRHPADHGTDTTAALQRLRAALSEPGVADCATLNVDEAGDRAPVELDPPTCRDVDDVRRSTGPGQRTTPSRAIRTGPGRPGRHRTGTGRRVAPPSGAGRNAARGARRGGLRQPTGLRHRGKVTDHHGQTGAVCAGPRCERPLPGPARTGQRIAATCDNLVITVTHAR